MTSAAKSQTKMATLIFGVAIFFVLALQGCSQPTDYRWQGSTMGTTYSVVASSLPEGIDTEELGREIDLVLAEVNEMMSTYIEDSELSLLNQNSSLDWVPLSKPLFDVLECSVEISEKTSGAYDVTIGPLVNLWGFGPGSDYSDTIPKQNEIESAQAKVGFDKLTLDRTKLVLKKQRPDIYIDLSSIAKGYGVDEIANLLRRNGIDNFLAEIGGELISEGLSSRGDAWKIAVEKPVSGQPGVQRILDISGQAVATSGDYRNYFEKDGVRYSHTLSGVTGKPVTHRLASVTVVAETTMAADAWATALFVLGEKDGLAIANQEGLAAYFVYKGNDGFETTESKEFKRSFGESLNN